MNMSFGAELIRQLVRLMVDSKSMRNRVELISSNRLSLDSLEDSRCLERNDEDELLSKVLLDE